MRVSRRWSRLRVRISNHYARVRKRDTVATHLGRFRWRVTKRTWLVGGAALLLTVRWAGAATPPVDPRTPRVQRVVDLVRVALDITEPVIVELVPVNPRVASVQPLDGRVDAFLLSVQGDFLDQLADDELEAMVAHELGHVWIYTHHPYLQTEQLANRVAMRRVSREQLARVYVKVWGASGYKQELAEFLGVASSGPRRAPEAPLAGPATQQETAPAAHDRRQR